MSCHYYQCCLIGLNLKKTDERNCLKLVIMIVPVVVVVGIVAAWAFDVKHICVSCLFPKYCDAEDAAWAFDVKHICVSCLFPKYCDAEDGLCLVQFPVLVILEMMLVLSVSQFLWCWRWSGSCLVHRSCNAEDDVCLNGAVADSSDEQGPGRHD